MTGEGTKMINGLWAIQKQNVFEKLTTSAELGRDNHVCFQNNMRICLLIYRNCLVKPNYVEWVSFFLYFGDSEYLHGISVFKQFSNLSLIDF